MYSVLVFVLFVLTAPFSAVIALLVLVTSGRPVLFRQRRIGLHGKPFFLFKFRTMVVGAEIKQRALRARNESKGPVFKIRDDPRFTPFGKFLSHTGFDELPQVWNVLRGEMEFIGPRPLPVSEEHKLKSWMKERERIKPGIISPAILTGKYHKDFVAWMKSDVAYVRTKSVSVDALLLVRFMPFVVRLVLTEFMR